MYTIFMLAVLTAWSYYRQSQGEFDAGVVLSFTIGVCIAEFAMRLFDRQKSGN